MKFYTICLKELYHSSMKVNMKRIAIDINYMEIIGYYIITSGIGLIIYIYFLAY